MSHKRINGLLDIRGRIADNARIDQNIVRLVEQDLLYRTLLGARDKNGLMELVGYAMPCVARKALQAAREIEVRLI